MATEREGEKTPTRKTHSSNLRKAVRAAENNLRKVRRASVLSFFWDFVRNLETRVREGDQAVSYKHLKTMNFNGKQARTLYIKDEDGILLRDGKLVREQWVRLFEEGTLVVYPSTQKVRATQASQGELDRLD